ncbi:MAG: copper chaperone PCu(A)C [Rubrimonas sp.]
MTRTLFAAALLALAAPALAHEFTLGDLRIDHPYAFESSGSTGAGYMTLTNAGHAPVALVGARSTAAPRVEIHETEVDAAGIARMIAQERVEIGPGETVVFEPQGLHVMFMGLAAPLSEGDRLPAELVFDKGAIAVEFWIEKRGAGAPAHDHGAHGHGG